MQIVRNVSFRIIQFCSKQGNKKLKKKGNKQLFIKKSGLLPCWI